MIPGDNRDLNGRGVRWRALTPAQSAEVARRLAAGVPARALASEYDVCVRTVYRAAEVGRVPFVVVRVESWRAEFAITEGGPVRCTPWTADS